MKFILSNSCDGLDKCHVTAPSHTHTYTHTTPTHSHTRTDLYYVTKIKVKKQNVKKFFAKVTWGHVWTESTYAEQEPLVRERLLETLDKAMSKFLCISEWSQFWRPSRRPDVSPQKQLEQPKTDTIFVAALPTHVTKPAGYQASVNEPITNMALFKHCNTNLQNTINNFMTAIRNQNSIHEEMKSRLQSGNACYHSVQNFIFQFTTKKCKD